MNAAGCFASRRFEGILDRQFFHPVKGRIAVGKRIVGFHFQSSVRNCCTEAGGHVHARIAGFRVCAIDSLFNGKAGLGKSPANGAAVESRGDHRIDFLGRLAEDDEDGTRRIELDRNGGAPFFFFKSGSGFDLAGVRMPELGRLSRDAECAGDELRIAD